MKIQNKLYKPISKTNLGKPFSLGYMCICFSVSWVWSCMTHRGSNTRDLLILGDFLTGPCYMDCLACPVSFVSPCEVRGYPEDRLSAVCFHSQFLLPATIEPEALASPQAFSGHLGIKKKVFPASKSQAYLPSWSKLCVFHSCGLCLAWYSQGIPSSSQKIWTLSPRPKVTRTRPGLSHFIMYKKHLRSLLQYRCLSPRYSESASFGMAQESIL
jgi:hypothetical protein